MNLLLLESVTAAAFGRSPDGGLVAEAELMLGAMVAEAVAPAVKAADRRLSVRVLRSHDLPPRWTDIEWTVPAGGWVHVWREALAWADAVWLVAPETGGDLEALSRAVESAGVRLLGASPAAVAVAASKSACHAALAGRVRQPADRLGHHVWVLKPDDGVAADGVRRVELAPAAARGDAASAAGAPSASPPLAPPGWLVQPFVEGESLSLCVLSDDRAVRVLSVNRQHVRWDAEGRARYCGGVTNAIADRERFLPMARTVHAAIPGLRGCWGIDCVLPDAGEPVLIEVNPRLTTAFAHLHAATGVDLLPALLGSGDGAPLPEAPAGRAVAFALPAATGATA